MSKQITKTVYEFSELTGAAKERAADWLCDAATDGDWWDATYDDAEEIGVLMGLEIGRVQRGKYQERDMWFSGFSSQGDGACWGGRIDWRMFNGAARRVKDYAPQDAELHRIAKSLQQAYDDTLKAVKAAARRGKGGLAVGFLNDNLPSFYVRSDDRYHSQRVEGDDMYLNDEEIFSDAGEGFNSSDLIDAAQEAANDFAQWVYKTLEAEYEYQTSEEHLKEMAEANEWMFTASGAFEGEA